MTFTVNIDPIRVYVRNSYLGLKDKGMTEAYLIAVTSIPNRPLFFTVHLSTGAVWSRLPITALFCDRFGANAEDPPLELDMSKAQPFSCLKGDIQYISYTHLKDCDVALRDDSRGTYLFTIDVMGPGLSEDPVQHKTHNICVLTSGNLIAYPNNYLLFIDKFFTDNTSDFPKYKRVDMYYGGVE